LLLARYKDHWYPDQVLRGCGYRAITFDRRVDVLLTQSAEAAGIMDIAHRLQHVRHRIMFVNPGFVKVRNATLPNVPPICIYSKVSLSSSNSSSSHDTTNAPSTPDRKSHASLSSASIAVGITSPAPVGVSDKAKVHNAVSTTGAASRFAVTSTAPTPSVPVK
jgi:BTG family